MMLLLAGCGEDDVSSRAPDAPSLGTFYSSITTADSSGNMGLAWDGSNLWVNNRDTGVISKLDDSGAVLTSFSTGIANGRGLTWDGSTLWLANAGAYVYLQFDPSNGSLLNSVSGPTGASYLTALAWDGTYLWYANYGDGTIYQLDADTANVITSIPSPTTETRGMTYFSGSLWVSSGNCSTTVYKVYPADGTVLDSFITSLGEDCSDMAYDGTFLWINSFTSATVNKYSPGPLP